MTSTRKLILDHLQYKPFASANELSRALKMTPANVRHHLYVLIQEGAVEMAAHVPSHGRGRPALLYTKTQQSRSHNLDGLAHSLLEIALDDGNSEEKQTQVLQQIASHLAPGQDPTRASLASLTHRLGEAVQQLNALGYQARWEAHSQAPHLLLGHCPYLAILPEHPELCQMDAYLLEHLLGVPVSQQKKLAQDSRGARYCLFVAKKIAP